MGGGNQKSGDKAMVLQVRMAADAGPDCVDSYQFKNFRRSAHTVLHSMA
jgi:hypothetical protein